MELLACFLAAALIEILWVEWARAVNADQVYRVAGTSMLQAGLGLIAYKLGLDTWETAGAVILGNGVGAVVGMKMKRK